jgi:hypothetical protein
MLLWTKKVLRYLDRPRIQEAVTAKAVKIRCQKEVADR